jgi:hypothetical protein
LSADLHTNNGYVLAEWYGGYNPEKGDFVVGAFSQHGMKTLFFGRNHEEGQAYIEDYWLEDDNALEQLSDNCIDFSSVVERLSAGIGLPGNRRPCRSTAIAVLAVPDTAIIH